ncbi:hypothetical protein SERLA73DRAFT_173936, partial [Serpula lacrymans var. lacrymans S7.3]
MMEESPTKEPCDQRRTFQLGDPLGEVAQRLLTEGTPYPGDEVTDRDTYDLGRFSVYRVSDHEHVITDSYRWLEDDVWIPTSFLLDTKFCVADWYADQRGQSAGFPQNECEEYYSYLPMGDAIGDRVEELLNMGQPYPCEVNLTTERTEGRFICLP